MARRTAVPLPSSESTRSLKDLSRWDRMPPICNWVAFQVGRDSFLGWVSRGLRGLA